MEAFLSLPMFSKPVSLLYRLQIAGKRENVFLHLYFLPLNERAVSWPTENYEADQEWQKMFSGWGKRGLLWANVIHLRKGWQSGSKINEVLSDLPELGTAIMWNIGVSKQGGRYRHLLCAMENQNLHFLRSYSAGETQQVQSHKGMF